LGTLLLSPSLLSADLGHLADQVHACEAGGADWLHFDVIDGAFAPNITFGPVVLQAVRAATALPIEVHLMIECPERFLAAFADAGASMLTLHHESTPHIHRALTAVRELGLRAGLALNPGSPLALAQDLIPDLDLLLIMTVNPGYSGQRFIRSMLPKLRAARALLDEHRSPALLSVDGGVSVGTAAEVVAAGATYCVAGSGTFSGDPRETIPALRAAAEGRRDA
jgi:ribulose-phosphate 3-epimerase